MKALKPSGTAPAQAQAQAQAQAREQRTFCNAAGG